MEKRTCGGGTGKSMQPIAGYKNPHGLEPTVTPSRCESLNAGKHMMKVIINVAIKYGSSANNSIIELQ